MLTHNCPIRGDRTMILKSETPAGTCFNRALGFISDAAAAANRTTAVSAVGESKLDLQG
jgi:hypothetical protein